MAREAARLARVVRADPELGGSEYRAAIQEAAAVIRRGGLVGFPTETVYGLAADGLDPVAVAKVYEVKERPLDSALILHLADASEALRYTTAVPPAAGALMDAFWPGPLTLIFPRAGLVPEITAGGRDNIGMRVPDHRVARDLVRAAGRPVVGPSANLSGRPSPMTAQDVLDDLGGMIDLVLDSGQTSLGIESTVLDLTLSPPVVHRPGSVTLEQLREYLPRLVVAGGSVGVGGGGGGRDVQTRPSAQQGMRLILVDGPPGAQSLGTARALAARYAATGSRVGLIAQLDAAGGADGTVPAPPSTQQLLMQAQPGEVRLASLGPEGDLHAAAARLYPALRSLEAAGCEIAVAAPLPRHGLGVAIMNRLEKAAAEVVGQ